MTDWLSDIWGEGESPSPEEIDIYRGRGPWRPWHFVGTYTVSPGKVRPAQLVALNAKSELRRMVAWHVAAVLISTRAINRMVGHVDEHGLAD